MGRVAAIGVDAAEWSLMEELFATGELPHLAAVRERSAVARLEDPVDFRTGLVWEHFLTGRGAAGNRRWGAVEFDPSTYEVWQEGARPETPFYAADPPLRAVIFDVPYASPARPVDGAVVVGWGGHDPGYPRASEPPGLLREIDARFGPHPACGNDYDIVWYRPDAIDRLCDGLIVGARRRADAAAWLLRRYPDWELFLTVLSEPHSAGEQLWHGIDPELPTATSSTAALAGRRLREVYRAVDDAVGRIVATLPDDAAVVVFSMHGMAGNTADVPSMVLLPELLYRLQTGDVRMHGEADIPPGTLVIPYRGWTPHVRGLFGDRASLAQRVRGKAGGLRRRLAGHGDGAPVEAAVGVLGHPIPAETDLTPDDIGIPRSTVDWQIALQYREWWPCLEAFALPTFYDGRIRLNVVGRERDGIVPVAAYDEVCDRLERELLDCRDAHTGQPLVSRVDRPRRDDPMACHGPDADLLVVWATATDTLEHPRVGRVGPVPYRRTGGHSSHGFAFVAGPGIEPTDLGVCGALDVTPTVVELLGRPIPPALEGTSLLAATANR
jgi:predicted AlkP superfamily phosphohydrolase/phosphomutase